MNRKNRHQFKTTRSARPTRRSDNPNVTPRVCVEALEGRWLMHADVWWIDGVHTLHIYQAKANTNDTFEIDFHAEDGTITALHNNQLGQHPGDGGTTSAINDPIPVSEFSAVWIETKEGNDKVVINSLPPNKAVTISAGEGDDEIEIKDWKISGKKKVLNGATILGEGGEDTIKGGSGSNWVYGGNDNDTISTIYGTVYGDKGNDTIVGGPSGNEGNHYLHGGAGNDYILCDGNDRAFGEGGNDTVYGGHGNNKLSGGADNDLFYAGGYGKDTVYGDGGQDTITGGGSDSLYGGDGNDSIFADTSTVYGEGGNDTITGGNGRDDLHGGKDDDSITGGGGNDSLYGDGGNDKIFAGSGDDYLYGDLGADLLKGEGGRDDLDGGGQGGRDGRRRRCPPRYDQGRRGGGPDLWQRRLHHRRPG